MGGKCTIGLDFGTNSVRALLVEVETGREVAARTWDFEAGERGIVLDPARPLLARHDPRDYLRGLEDVVRGVLAEARAAGGFDASDVIGIGVDATATTPVPVDRSGRPLSFSSAFEGDPDAMAWLWKDHTATAEAEEITALARELRPAWLGKIGGAYSSEWFWSKLLKCRRQSPAVFAASWSWVEMCDLIPATLAGDTRPEAIKRSACAAGHKALYHPDWGGWPDVGFLSTLDPELARIAATFHPKAYPIGELAGRLCQDWAGRLGLPSGVALSVGSVDAHVGAVGAGITPRTLVKVIGTSGVDMMVAESSVPLPDIPGLAGVVPDSILPGHYGLEAGQSAVGDVYQWFADLVSPGVAASHAAIQEEALALKPGESGLLALDWHNGNRTILMDQRLTGAIVGLTLQSRQAEIYRALVEATAFGNRVITRHFEENACPVDRVVAGGGIALKSPMTMQIFADVLGKDIEVARSAQTGALGGAIAASVAAGKAAGGHAGFREAIAAMTGAPEIRYKPDGHAAAVYDELFALYRSLHDAFGRTGSGVDLGFSMKALIEIRDRERRLASQGTHPVAKIELSVSLP